MEQPKLKETLMFDSDISDEYLEFVCKSKIVAWDIETSGLDWHCNEIGTCQLYIPDGIAAIIHINNVRPRKMCRILNNSRIKKVFHHAVFDLRFICSKWNVHARNIACTKIASKLLYAHDNNQNSLDTLLTAYLGIKKDKGQTLSNWFARDLSVEQIDYAVNDVRYLILLLNLLENDLAAEGLLEFVHQCFDHIPTRVKLDILGYGDIYTH